MSRSSSEGRALDVVLELRHLQAGTTPEVRVWFDLDTCADLRSEFEVGLKLLRSWRWQGTVLLDPAVEHFFYRVGLKAHAGADWSLTVRDRELGRDLIVDGDSLGIDKCWLVGSSWLPRGARAYDKRGATHGLAIVMPFSRRR